MGQGSPLFIDVTWHAAGNPGDAERPNSSMAVASAASNYAGW